MSQFVSKSFTIPTLLAMALFCGAATGLTVHQKLKPTLFSISGDASAYVPDGKTALASYESAKKMGGDFAAHMKPFEMVYVAYERYRQNEYAYAEGVGTSKAMGLVDQAIQSRNIKNGEEYFEESNSFSSFVALYNRMYQKGETTTKYWGKSSNYGVNSPVDVTNEEYASSMGRKVSEPLIYLISDKTDSSVDRSGRGLTKVSKDELGNIQVEFEADPKTSTLRYIHQMKTISDLKDFPNFEYVHLQWSFTKDLDLRYFKSYEKYHATLSNGIGSDCEGSMTTVYVAGDSSLASIPSPSSPSAAYPSSEAALLKAYGYNQ
ncbi:MAG: hypothetical protein SOV58_03570 [Candidatus Enteromonas sp.]|nr:hypothetical protein [Candidatus Enteromonas sp.]